MLAPSIWATNGYFTHGYGTANEGLAGAGVALPQGSLIVATNPAGLVFLGQRIDAGLAYFTPSRRYTVDGAPTGLPGTFGLQPESVEGGSTDFFIPHFGARWDAGSDGAFGLALYGHGGMNTDYAASPFYGSSPTGVDLSQLFVVPTYAFRVGTRHAFGVSGILAYQRFEMQGLQAFGPFSSNPDALTNNGHDDSTGLSWKVGYLGRINDHLSFGASYQAEISMGEFDDYAGLFAEQGGFDIPATWTAGVALSLTPRVTVVFDVQETMYSEVAAVGAPLLPALGLAQQGNPNFLLGTDNGPGFGWQDMTTYEAGVQFEGGRGWTWRFGASSGDQPVPESEMLFNILSPGVMKDHLTAGFSKQIGTGDRAFHMALMHAPSVSVRGVNPLEAPIPGQQEIELEMDQWELEFSFTWAF